MNNRLAVPRPHEVRDACQLIRANWTSSQRRARRQLAATRRRQLMQWLEGEAMQLAGCRSAEATVLRDGGIVKESAPPVGSACPWAEDLLPHLPPMTRTSLRPAAPATWFSVHVASA